jgi:hypothetical protein
LGFRKNTKIEAGNERHQGKLNQPEEEPQAASLMGLSD